ncbi:MAG: tetratricopeptide repeat protein, partial [Thermodesulfobacteriota bacterium]
MEDNSVKSARTLYLLADKERQRSRYGPAAFLYGEAMALAPSDRALKLDCSFAIGDCYRLTGDFVKSARSYRTARRLCLAVGDASGERDALVGLGLCYRATGRFAEAVKIFNDALRFYRNHADKAA